MAIRFLSDRRGNTAVFFGLMLPVLVGFVGLGGETGFWYWKQRQLQGAADVASYVGATRLRDDYSDGEVTTFATSEAQLHGYDPALAAIDVNLPPQSGTHQNDHSVEVLITHTQPRFFSGVISSGPVTFTVRAVSSYQDFASVCVLALHKTKEGAITVWGGADVVFDNCVVMSDSLDEQSILFGGSSSMKAPCVSAVGGVDAGPDSLTLTKCAQVTEYAHYVNDPYADVPAPAVTGACKKVTPGPPGTPITLNPGRYCNGMTLSGDVTLNPGIYIIDGGVFTILANANVKGTGVTFYITAGADINWNGAAQVKFTAPTSGTYAGILFFGDRSEGYKIHKFNGTAGSGLIGALYFAEQGVELVGDFSGSNKCTQVVALTVQFSGNNGFSADCAGVGMQDIELSGFVKVVE